MRELQELLVNFTKGVDFDATQLNNTSLNHPLISPTMTTPLPHPATSISHPTVLQSQAAAAS